MSIFAYTKNAAKSIGINTLKGFVKEKLSGTFELTSAIVDNRDSIKEEALNIRAFIKKDVVDDVLKVAWKNTKQAAKSGKFVRSEDEMNRDIEKSMGFDDFDSDFSDDSSFSSGDDSSDDNSFSLDDEGNTGSQLEGSTNISDNRTTNVINKKSSKAIFVNGGSDEAATFAAMRTTARISVGNTRVLASYMARSNNILATISDVQKEQNQTMMRIYNEGVLTRPGDYETSVGTAFGEILIQLQELNKASQVRLGVLGVDLEGAKLPRNQAVASKYDAVMSEFGDFDSVAYAKLVGRNIRDIFSDLDMFKEVLVHPFELASQMVVEKLVPKKITESMERINKIFSGIPASFLLTLEEWSNNDNFFKKMFGKVFGGALGRSGQSASSAIGDYEKGAIPFDGITKRAIVEVIPGFLSKILNVLKKGSDSDEMVYDYNTGLYTNKKQIAKEYEKKRLAGTDGEISSGIKEQVLGKFQFDDEKQKKLYSEEADNILAAIFSKSGKYKGDFQSDSYNKDLIEQINKTFSGLGYSSQMKFQTEKASYRTQKQGLNDMLAGDEGIAYRSILSEKLGKEDDTLENLNDEIRKIEKEIEKLEGNNRSLNLSNTRDVTTKKSLLRDKKLELSQLEDSSGSLRMEALGGNKSTIQGADGERPSFSAAMKLRSEDSAYLDHNERQGEEERAGKKLTIASIKDFFKHPLDSVASGISRIGDRVGAAFFGKRAGTDGAVNDEEGIVDKVSNFFKPLKDKLSDWFKDKKSFFSDLWNGSGGSWGIRDHLSNIFSPMKTSIKLATGKLKDYFSQKKEILSNFTSKIWNGDENSPGLKATIGDAFKPLKTSISSFSDKFKTSMKGWFENKSSSLKGFLSSNKDAIQGSLFGGLSGGAAGGLLLGAALGPVGMIAGALAGSVAGGKTGLNKITEWTKDKFSKMSDKASTFYNANRDKIQGSIVGLAGGAGGGLLLGAALGPIGMIAGALAGSMAGGSMGKEKLFSFFKEKTSAMSDKASTFYNANRDKILGGVSGLGGGALFGHLIAGAALGPLGMLTGGALGALVGTDAGKEKLFGFFKSQFNSATNVAKDFYGKHKDKIQGGAMGGVAAGILTGAALGPYGMIAGAIGGSLIGKQKIFDFVTEKWNTLTKTPEGFFNKYKDQIQGGAYGALASGVLAGAALGPYGMIAGGLAGAFGGSAVGKDAIMGFFKSKLNAMQDPSSLLGKYKDNIMGGTYGALSAGLLAGAKFGIPGMIAGGVVGAAVGGTYGKEKILGFITSKIDMGKSWFKDKFDKHEDKIMGGAYGALSAGLLAGAKFGIPGMLIGGIAGGLVGSSWGKEKILGFIKGAFTKAGGYIKDAFKSLGSSIRKAMTGESEDGLFSGISYDEIEKEQLDLEKQKMAAKEAAISANKKMTDNFSRMADQQSRLESEAESAEKKLAGKKSREERRAKNATRLASRLDEEKDRTSKLMNDMSDSISSAAGNAKDSFVAAVSNVSSQVASKSVDLLNSINTSSEETPKKLSDILDILKQKFFGTKPEAPTTASTAASASSPKKSLSEAETTYPEVEVRKATIEVPKKIDKIQNFLDEHLSGVGSNVAAIAAAMGVDDTDTSSTGKKSKKKGFFGKFKDMLKKPFSSLGSLIKDNIKGVLLAPFKAIRSTFTGITTSISTLFKAGKKAWDLGSKVFSYLGPKLLSGLEMVSGAAIKVASSLGKGLLRATEIAGKAIGGFASAIAKNVKPITEGLIKGLGTVTKGLFNFGSELGKVALSLTKMIGRGVSKISDKLFGKKLSGIFGEDVQKVEIVKTIDLPTFPASKVGRRESFSDAEHVLDSKDILKVKIIDSDVPLEVESTERERNRNWKEYLKEKMYEKKEEWKEATSNKLSSARSKLKSFNPFGKKESKIAGAEGDKGGGLLSGIMNLAGNLKGLKGLGGLLSGGGLIGSLGGLFGGAGTAAAAGTATAAGGAAASGGLMASLGGMLSAGAGGLAAAAMSPVGLALLGTAAVAGIGYGAYKLYKHVKRPDKVKKGDQLAKELKEAGIVKDGWGWGNWEILDWDAIRELPADQLDALSESGKFGDVDKKKMKQLLALKPSMKKKENEKKEDLKKESKVVGLEGDAAEKEKLSKEDEAKAREAAAKKPWYKRNIFDGLKDMKAGLSAVGSAISGAVSSVVDTVSTVGSKSIEAYKDGAGIGSIIGGNIKMAYNVAKETVKSGSPATKARAALLESTARSNGITDTTELAAFMAQMHHESGGFRYLEELASGDAYEGRKKLGNTQPGDGRRFKGRGFVQLTGRANYKEFGKDLGIDLIQNPESASEPEVAAKLAVAFWKKRHIGEPARAGNFDRTTRIINGGQNGAADRKKRYAEYLAYYGAGKSKVDEAGSTVTASAGDSSKVSEVMPEKKKEGEAGTSSTVAGATTSVAATAASSLTAPTTGAAPATSNIASTTSATAGTSTATAPTTPVAKVAPPSTIALAPSVIPETTRNEIMDRAVVKETYNTLAASQASAPSSDLNQKLLAVLERIELNTSTTAKNTGEMPGMGATLAKLGNTSNNSINMASRGGDFNMFASGRSSQNDLNALHGNFSVPENIRSIARG
jgi:predicted chitinase